MKFEFKFKSNSKLENPYKLYISNYTVIETSVIEFSKFSNCMHLYTVLMDIICIYYRNVVRMNRQPLIMLR